MSVTLPLPGFHGDHTTFSYAPLRKINEYGAATESDWYTGLYPPQVGIIDRSKDRNGKDRTTQFS